MPLHGGAEHGHRRSGFFPFALCFFSILLRLLPEPRTLLVLLDTLVVEPVLLNRAPLLSPLFCRACDPLRVFLEV